MSTVQQLFDLSGKVAIVTGAGTGLGVTFAGAISRSFTQFSAMAAYYTGFIAAF